MGAWFAPALRPRLPKLGGQEVAREQPVARRPALRRGDFYPCQVPPVLPARRRFVALHAVATLGTRSVVHLDDPLSVLEKEPRKRAPSPEVPSIDEARLPTCFNARVLGSS